MFWPILVEFRSKTKNLGNNFPPENSFLHYPRKQRTLSEGKAEIFALFTLQCENNKFE